MVTCRADVVGRSWYDGPVLSDEVAEAAEVDAKGLRRDEVDAAGVDGCERDESDVAECG